MESADMIEILRGLCASENYDELSTKEQMYQNLIELLRSLICNTPTAIEKITFESLGSLQTLGDAQRRYVLDKLIEMAVNNGISQLPSMIPLDSTKEKLIEKFEIYLDSLAEEDPRRDEVVLILDSLRPTTPPVFNSSQAISYDEKEELENLREICRVLQEDSSPAMIEILKLKIATLQKRNEELQTTNNRLVQTLDAIRSLVPLDEKN